MASFPSYMKTPRERETERAGKLIGFLIAWPLIAMILMWYNHVIIQWDVAYWQWLAVTIGVLLITTLLPWLKYVFGLILAASIIGQIASWIGLLSLPLIK